MDDDLVTDEMVEAAAAEFRRITKGDGMLTPQDKPMSIYEMAAHHILTAALSVSPLREQVQKLTEENEAAKEAITALLCWEQCEHVAVGHDRDKCHRNRSEKVDGYFAALSPSYKGEQ